MPGTSLDSASHRVKTLNPDASSAQTFKFVSFRDRLKHVSVSTTRAVLSGGLNPHSLDDERDDDELDSFLAQSISKWKELNCTTDYAKFARDVEPLARNLPMVLFHRDEIARLLVEHLKVEGSTALDGLSEAFVTFARDLEEEFYPLFPDLLAALLPHADSDDAKEVECVFNAIALSIKHLSRLMVPEFLISFERLKMLVENPRNHVRRFAAEGLAYLVRKLSQQAVDAFLDRTLGLLSASLEGTESIAAIAEPGKHRTFILADGLASLFAESIVGLGGALASRGLDLFSSLLSKFLLPNQPHPQLHEFLVLSTLASALPELNEDSFLKILDLLRTQSPSAAIFRLARMVVTIKPGIAKLAHKEWIAYALSALDKLNDEGTVSLAALFAHMSHRLSPVESARLIPLLKPLLDLEKPGRLAAFRLLAELDPLAGAASKAVAARVGKLVGSIAGLCLVREVLSGSEERVLVSKDVGKAIEAVLEKGGSEAAAVLEAMNGLEVVSEGAAELHGMLCGLFKRSLGEDNGLAARAFLAAARYGDVEELCRSGLDHPDPVLLDAIGEVVADKSIKLGDLETLYGRLKFHLSLPDSRLRRGVLRILEPCDESGTVSKLLRGELVEPTLATIREKQTVIAQLEGLQNSGRLPKGLGDCLARLCIGWLGVRFAPLWKDAGRVFVSFASRDLQGAWDVLMDALKPQTEGNDGTGGDQDEIVDRWDVFGKLENSVASQRVYRRAEVAAEETLKRFTDGGTLDKAKKRAEERPADSMPWKEQYVQLWKVLEGAPQVVEKRSEVVVKLVIEAVGGLEGESGGGDGEAEDDEDVNSEDGEDGEEVDKEASAKTPRGRKEQDRDSESHASNRSNLLLYLTVISKFKNGPGIHKAPLMRGLYMKLLKHAFAPLQKVALQCVFTWKSAALTGHADQLLALTEDAKFRETLAAIDLDAWREGIDPARRKEFFEVLAAILYGKLVSRSVRGRSGGALKARRNAIIRFLGSFTDDELALLVETMVEPFRNGMPEMRVQMGFLNLLGVFSNQLRTRVGPFLKDVVPILLKVLETGTKAGEEQMDVDSDGAAAATEHHEIRAQKRRLKDARNLAMKRIAAFSADGLEQLRPFIPQLFAVYLDERVDKFQLENVDGPSPTLHLLTAWASNETFRTHVVGKQGLLHNVFGTLKNEQASQSVVSAIVGLAEHLVPLFSELASAGAIDALVSGIESVLSRLPSGGNNRDASDLLLRCVALLSSAASAVEDETLLARVVDLLLPNLVKSSKIVSERVKAEVLGVIAGYLRRGPKDLAGCLRISPVYRTVSRCFSLIESRDGRTALNTCFESFLAVDPALAKVAGLVADMNAWSVRRLDEPDFDRRFAAFATISQGAYAEFTAQEWLPLLHNLIYSVRDDKEFSVRTNAAFCIVKLIDRAAELSGEVKDLVTFVVLPAIKQTMKRSTEAVRNEFLGLLAHAVKRLPEEPAFSDMACLIGTGDEDANVFSNITHMQQHRRMRGLKKLADHALAGHLKPATLANIFFPYFLHVVHEYDRSEEHSFIADTVSALGQMASVLTWTAYYSVLRGEIALVGKKPDREKTQVRLVVAMLDSFHFEMAVGNGGVDETKEEEADEGEEAEERTAAADKVAATTTSAAKVHSVVVERLLPELHRLLRDKDKNGDADAITLRVPVALAIAGLLVRLPQESLKEQLPKLLVDLAQRLRSFSQDLRDTTRSTLVKVTGMLGPSYLLFTVKELRTALTRGPQLHVLAYTVHAILAALIPSVKPGELDGCVDELAAVFQQDLFGNVAEEKEVEELAKKMRETKGSKSFDSFELLAGVVSLDRVGMLLKPLREAMEGSTQLNSTNAVDNALRRIASGLSTNPSITAGDLLIFVHGMLVDMLPRSATRQNKSSAAAAVTNVASMSVEALAARNLELNAHRFVLFALLLLLNAVRRELLKLNDEEHLRMLDPIVPLLVNAAGSKHAPVAVTSLKILGYLVKTPLPALAAAKENVLQTVLKSLGKTANLGSELVQQSLRFLAIIIRDDDAHLTNQQVGALISLVSPELEDSQTQTTSFTLIKAIIARRFISEDVYDLMDRVATLLVTSQSAEVRALCRQVWLPFFLDYPQSSDRVRKQINFLVTNLDYIHETGRESTMEMLNVVCRKLPAETLAQYMHLIVLALVTKMVSDDSSKCRQMATELVRTILGRLDASELQTMLDLAGKWSLPTSSDGLRIAAFQLYGILADLSPALVEPNVDTIVETVVRALEQVLADELADVGEDMDSQRWQVAYSALTLAIKLVGTWRDAVAVAPEAGALWEQSATASLHPHAWVRMAASRVLALRLAALEAGPREASSLRTLFNLVYKFATQLKSTILSQEQASQTVKNMFLLAKLFAKLGKNEGDMAQNGNNEDEDARPLPESYLEDPLGWMVLKFATMARSQNSKEAWAYLQRASIFRWFAALVSMLDQAASDERLLLPIIGALYHATQSETARGKDAEELKVTAQEVLDLLQSRVGTDAFLQVYNKVHLSAMSKRQERHEAKATLAVADPEKAAKRKMSRNDAKRDSKKRKIEERKRKKLPNKQKISLRSRNPEARV